MEPAAVSRGPGREPEFAPAGYSPRRSLDFPERCETRWVRKWAIPPAPRAKLPAIGPPPAPAKPVLGRNYGTHSGEGSCPWLAVYSGVQPGINIARHRRPRRRLGIGSRAGFTRKRRWQRRRRYIASQQRAEPFPELFHADVALDIARYRQADRPSFFRDDDCNSIRLFGDPDRRPMPRSQLRGQHGIHRERQEARRRRNAVALHDHGAIVQRSAGTKNGRQQVIRQPRVQGDTAFDVGTQANFALDHNQRARLVLGKQVGCEDDVVIGLSFGWGNTTKAEPGA